MTLGQPAFAIIRAGAIAALCLLMLWISLSVTLDLQLADTDPTTALRWWPFGAEATAGLAGSELALPVTRERARRAEALAGTALVREPVLAAAARTVGLAREVLSGPKAAGSAFAYAQAISRRDLATQVWMIERNVAAGNVSGALVHYDIALRTDPSAADLLLPVLASASDQPAVARALLPYLGRQPGWLGPYLDQLAHAATNPVTLAAQARAARLDPVAQSAALLPLIARLVALHRPQLARAVLGPGFSGPLHDGSFEQGGLYAPFDWWLRDDQNLSAERSAQPAADGRYVLRIRSGVDTGGEVAHQLLLLAPGRYLLRGTAAATQDGGGLAVSLECDPSGRALGTFDASLPARPRTFAVPFTVPSGCPTQWLRLSTPPARDVDEWVDALSIAAVAPGR